MRLHVMHAARRAQRRGAPEGLEHGQAVRAHAPAGARAAPGFAARLAAAVEVGGGWAPKQAVAMETCIIRRLTGVENAVLSMGMQ